MKRIIISILFLFIQILLLAEWREVQVVEIPENTPVYYEATDSGKIRCFFLIQGMQITVSERNAYRFKRGDVRLELVKWYDVEKNKYRYTVRQKSNQNIDLEKVFKNP